MECPFCGHVERRVVDSRPSMGTVRRRSECLSCKKRWTTMEIMVEHNASSMPKSKPTARLKARFEEPDVELPWNHTAYDDDGILIAPTISGRGARRYA